MQVLKRKQKQHFVSIFNLKTIKLKCKILTSNRAVTFILLYLKCIFSISRGISYQVLLICGLIYQRAQSQHTIISQPDESFNNSTYSFLPPVTPSSSTNYRTQRTLQRAYIFLTNTLCNKAWCSYCLKFSGLAFSAQVYIWQ